MRNRFPRAILLLAALALPAAANAQDEKPARKPDKGDTVVAVGCMRGSSLESQETRLADDDTVSLEAAITYRLTGDKEILKQLKAGHSRHLEAITGVLKSRLDPKAGLGTQIGKTGIYVGLGAPGASRAQPLPVLEVTAFKHVSAECGR